MTSFGMFYSSSHIKLCSTCHRTEPSTWNAMPGHAITRKKGSITAKLITVPQTLPHCGLSLFPFFIFLALTSVSMVCHLRVKYHTPVWALRCSSRSILRILLQIWKRCVKFLCVWFTWGFFPPFLLLTPSSAQHKFCCPRLHSHCPVEITRTA